MGQEVRRAKDMKGTIARIWGYMRQQRQSLIAAGILVVITTLLGLANPYLMGHAIDAYIDKHDLNGLFKLCGLMLVVVVLNAGFTWVQAYIMVGAAQRAIRQIREDLFAKLQLLPLQYFDQNPHGELMSRLTNDVERISQVLSDSLAQLASGLLSLVGIVIVMLLMNPILTVVSLTTLIAMTLGLNRSVAKKIRAAFREQQAAMGELNGIIEETVSGQRVVKAYNREALALEDFQEANERLRDGATKAQTVSGYIGPFMNLINNTGLAIVAGVGGALVVRGFATVGTIASFINYSRQFGRPLNDIANLYNAIQSAIAGAERVFDVIDTQPEVDAPALPEPRTIAGEVEMRDVTFSYVPGVPVLKNISLHANPGQTIALIGPTGAGKTTIVNLLTRFYEIDSGQILIDGNDLTTYPKEDLRRRLGIVLQDTYLFSGTVRENIRYGRLEATEDEIVAAATLANADAFIRHLPHGYDTQLTERAGNLSHGQRQLLAIARAVLADPQILILDEATSSVDTRTEKHIQEAMLRLMEGRTSFVIAHRLSTIREADQILAIVGGEIVERGTHDELMAQKGFYHGLVCGAVEALP